MVGRPLVIAHRGLASAGVAENSLAAVRAALALGCDGVEIDVRTSRDGALVLMHDASTARTAGEPGVVVEDTDLADLRALRLRGLVPEPVPLLAEALPLVLAADATCVVDVKDPRPGERLVDALAALLEPVGAEQRGRVVLQSRDQGALVELATRVPGVGTSWLTWRRLRGDAGVAGLARPSWSAVPARVRRDHRAGCRVLAWTVNREDVARRLLARGVDGLITDEPARMLDLVRAERRPA